jgi:hypothetical protein
MELTGKCKEDFENYIQNLQVAPYVSMLDQVPKCYLNALIIDFLDSVNLFIGVDSWRSAGNKEETYFWYNVKDINQESLINSDYHSSIYMSMKKTRLEATNEAILKANTIYNE